MLLRILATLILVTSVAQGCSCAESEVQVKLRESVFVFRGTILELRPGRLTPAPKFVKDTGKSVIFRVSEVWKGDVSSEFQMPAILETSMCTGFWPDFLHVGADLLVYVRGSEETGYFTSICGRHKPAKDAGPDLKELGPGRVPK